MMTPRTVIAAATPERVPTGELMRLVADGLKAQGFRVRLPAMEDERRFSIERWGGHCDLSVSDFGFVEWDCVPWASSKPDPKMTADVATFLLTGETGNHPFRDSVRSRSGMTFKGIVGHELKARGFDVSLEVYEDDRLFDVWADIAAKNPVARTSSTVHISDDGAIAWECECRYQVTSITDSLRYFEVLSHHRELAEYIAAMIAGAVSLSAGMSPSRVSGGTA